MVAPNLGQRRVDAIESEAQQLRAVGVGPLVAYPPTARALPFDEDEEARGPDLRQLFAAVRYRRWSVAVTLGIGCALFVLAAALIPPSFTAVAQIDVALSSGGGGTPVDSRASQMIVDTHLVTLKSRDFLRLALVKSLEMFPNDPSGDEQARFDANSLSHDKIEWLLERFEKRISVNQSLSSSVISIGYTSQSPDHAAGVANLLVSLYRGMLKEREEATQKARLEQLGERISELQRKSDLSRARLLEQLQNPSGSDNQAAGGDELAQLEAEVHTNAQLVADLLRRQAEARRSLEMFGSSISVVSLASSPVSRSSLHPALFIAPGAVLLLIGICFWAVGREQWDPRLRSAADVARVLGLPCIGLLPRRKWSPLLRRGHFAAEKPFAPHTETIRSVAAALDVATPSHACQLVLLTCAGHDEGKTTLAIDIAEYATTLGKRVLLVDLDARTPALLRELKVQANHGLSDIVLHDADPQALVQKCPGISFYFLPMRPTAIDPLTLVASEKLHAALEGFRSAFDLVLIDGPQIAGRADALLLPELMDRVLFVAKWGTRLQPAKDVVRALRGGRPARSNESGSIACVVTRVPANEHSQLQAAVPLAPVARLSATCCRTSWRG